MTQAATLLPPVGRRGGWHGRSRDRHECLSPERHGVREFCRSRASAAVLAQDSVDICGRKAALRDWRVAWTAVYAVLAVQVDDLP